MRAGFGRGTRRALWALTVISLLAAAWTGGMTARATSARAEPTFTPGVGVAETAPFGVNIVYNNANVGISVAAASASYASTSAKATATPYGFGLAALISAITVCGEHPVPPGFMTPPLEAKSDEGGGKPVERSAGQDGTFANGTGHVRAAPGADAQSDTKAVAVEIPALATLSGGEAHARARTDAPSMARAVATDTSVDLELLGGLVRLDGMRFQLDQRAVGADHRTTKREVNSAVSFGTAVIAGVPLPLPSDSVAALQQLNTALGPLGLQLVPPALVADGQFGHRLTPMTIRIGGKSAYSEAVAALSGTPEIIQLQQILQDALFDTQECNQLAGIMKAMPELNSTYNALGIATPILLAVIVSALAGGGSIDVQVGGARTRIDDTYYEVPPFDPPASAPPAAPTPGSAGTPSVSGPGAAPAAPTPTPSLDAQPASSQCATTSPAERPACWPGLAPIGALAAFFLCGGLLAVDEIRRRRLTSALPPPSEHPTELA